MIVTNLGAIAMKNYWHSILALTFNAIFMIYVSSNSFRVQEATEARLERLRRAEEGEEELGEPIEDHFTERFGLFVMICTGETILALIINFSSFEQTFETYLCILIAYAMMYLVKMLYFSANEKTLGDLSANALTTPTSPGAVVFVVAHCFLGYLLLGIGVGWKLVFYGLSTYGYTYMKFRVFLGVMIGGVAIFLVITRFAHETYIATPTSMVRVLVIGALPAVIIGYEDTVIATVIATLTLFILFVMDRQMFDEVERKDNMNNHCDVDLPMSACKNCNGTEVTRVLPWETRMEVEDETGAVLDVGHGGQAASHGVQRGWKIHQVNGHPYTFDLFYSHVSGQTPYTMTFSS